MSKRYTPVSPIDSIGYFSLIIKVYRPNDSHPKGGIVSQFIDRININDSISVTGPIGKLEYLGEGKMLIKEKEEWKEKKFKNC